MSTDHHTKRRLAAILFADIVGYTAMMQSDEGVTMSRLQKYQTVLNTSVESYKGEVIKNYGDGSLCIFSSVLDAVQCARAIQKELQVEPKVPLRIGLHLGDVMFKANDIYGNDINISSRIESMGIAGAILMSKNVYQKVNNQADLKFESLGDFEFKNVNEPIAVYALANEGLAVPERDQMKGKFKVLDSKSPKGFLQRMWDQKIPQIMGGYLLMAWFGFQFFDWILNQFRISPHWAEIFLIVAIGLVPTILLYLFNRERIHKSQLNWREKILFPSNFILLGAVLFFMFRSADLGATQKDIIYINAQGVEETRNIVKSEFRKQFVLFPFDEMELDSVNQWIGLGMSHYLEFELNQNKYLSPQSYSFPKGRKATTSDKIEAAVGYKENYYVDGTYKVSGDLYELVPALRKSNNGKLIAEKRFAGRDLFKLIDSISVFISKSVGLTQSQIDQSSDLDFGEMMTNNVDALKEFTLGMTGLAPFHQQAEKAILEDSTFAYAYLRKAHSANFYNRGKLESKYLIKKAMEFRRRLPYETQIDLMTENHIINEEWDKAEKLLKIQLDIDPNNDIHNQNLINLYFITEQVDKIVEHSNRRFNEDPTNLLKGADAMSALLLIGECEEVIQTVRKILPIVPNEPNVLIFLAEANMHCEDYQEARTLYEKLILLHPEYEKFIQKALNSIDYLEKGEHPDLIDFIGDFRSESTELIVQHRIISDHVFSKALNQGGHFFFPSGPTELSKGYNNESYVQDYIFDESQTVYGVSYTESDTWGESTRYYYKQDSTIWNAEKALREGGYEMAIGYYEQAVKDNPKHYYLEQGAQHADYMLNHTAEDIANRYERIAGEYDGVKIWVEDGHLYYSRLGASRRILRPVSDDRFTTLLNYSWIYELVRENGEIVGLQGYLYNKDTEEWELFPDWYFERERLLN